MSAQVLTFKKRECWRYRFVCGELYRYWSTHDRSPQVWEGEWKDVGMAERVTHEAPELVQ